MVGRAWDTSQEAPRPSWALPTLRRPRANIAPLGTHGHPLEQEFGLIWLFTPGNPNPGARSPSAHLARLVELFLQPRHRHSAFSCGTSRPDPANRRYSTSDRIPGAAEPPRASTGPVGAASAALSPAPRPSGRSLSPSCARAARILHGNRTLPAPAPSEHARAPCRPESASALLLLRWGGEAASASQWPGKSLERPERLQRPLEYWRWL